jgi:methionine sulfoxide reductase heme-binding subunit
MVCYDGVMVTSKTVGKKAGLLSNGRFWILAVGVVMSVNIAGLIQFFVPGESLQAIRIEQTYGVLATLLLIMALAISPLTKLYPTWSYKDQVVHARRAIGVLAFYYAALHMWLTFFLQFDGFGGLQYLNSKYLVAFICGFVALVILAAMAATSFDWAIHFMTFRRWKWLHRLVYTAGLAIVVHVVLVGSHTSTVNLLSIFLGLCVVGLLWLEARRLGGGRKAQPTKSIGKQND